jgi:F-type H+-transporting ATPase subunit a
MSFLSVASEKPSIDPDIIFQIGNFPVSSSMLMVWLITAILIIFSLYTSRRLKLNPGKGQNIVESIYIAMENLINQITGDRKFTTILYPLIATLFIFIAFSNLLSIIIPFLTSITYNGMAMFRTPTSDFNTPFALGAAMIIYIQYISIRKWGILKHLGKYFQFKQLVQSFKKGIGEGFMGIINFLIGLLDIITEFARVISLSIRLFGNMFAGEMLAIIILGFVAYGLPAVWMSMSLLVGVIQAMVFGSLTAAYYMLAVQNIEDN